MTTVQTLEVVITADTSALRNGLNEAENSKTNWGTVGRNMGLAFTTAFAAVVTQGVKDAMTFESAFADVRKTVDGTDEELAILEDRLRGMATDKNNPLAALDNAAVTLFEIAALGGQLGIATSDLEQFVQVVGNLTVASDLSAESAAEFIARFANVTGMPVSDYQAFSDAIVTLGNNMALKESDLTTFANRISGLSSFGFTPDQILAYAAAMGSLGLNAEAGGTALTTAVNKIVTIAGNEEEMAAFADALGLTADEFSDLAMTNTPQALLDFINAYSQLGTADRLQFNEDFGFDPVRMSELLLRLSEGSDVLATALGLSEDAFDGNGAAMDEAKAKADTLEGRFEVLQNNLKDLSAIIGEIFVPILNDVIPKVVDAVRDVQDGLEAFKWAWEQAGTVVGIVLDRITRGLEIWVLDAKLRFLEFVNSFRQLVLDATGGQIDIAPDLNFSTTETQARLAAIDAVDQFTDGLKTQLQSGEGIDLSEIVIQNGDFSQVALDSVTLDPGSLSFDPTVFGAEARYAIQQALRTAYEEGNLQDIETLTALALALEIDTNVVEQDMQAILGAREFFAEVVTNLRVAVSNVDSSAVMGAIGSAAAAAGSFLGNVLPSHAGGGTFHASGPYNSGLALLHDGEQILTPAQQRAGAGSGNTAVFNVTTVGMSARQVLEMIKREAESQGF